MITRPRTELPQHVRRLITLGYVSLALAMGYFWHEQVWENTVLSFANLLMLALGTVPMLRWLQRNDITYPIVEFLLATTVPFYAIPALTGHEALLGFPEETLLGAALVVIAFQLACIIGSVVAANTYHPTPIKHRSWWRTEIMAETKMTFTTYTLMIFTVWILISSLTDWIPSSWIGTLRAVFFGIGILSIFIQARLWGAGVLSPTLKTVFIVNVLIQIIVTFVSLLLINGMSIVLTALLGYFSIAKRVPWIPVVIALPVFAVLHNGKSEMRHLYWEKGEPLPGIVEMPAFFAQWVDLGLHPSADGDQRKDQALTYGLMRRASLFQIVSIAVDTMPERASFLYGASYSIIPPQILPRFLWPSKPSPHDSVKMLSVKFGILSMEETEVTSVGFGLLTEAYANFGFVSISMLGFVFGLSFRRLALATEDCATLSPAGLFRILCLVWCLSSEVTLAVWVSSLYQACVAIGAPLLAFRAFSHD